jgi:hypothetical protein
MRRCTPVARETTAVELMKSGLDEPIFIHGGLSPFLEEPCDAGEVPIGKAADTRRQIGRRTLGGIHLIGSERCALSCPQTHLEEGSVASIAATKRAIGIREGNSVGN